jgi:hypothetical protein
VRGLARQYEDLWRFYVFAPEERREAVRRRCEELFGLPSAYRREG